MGGDILIVMWYRFIPPLIVSEEEVNHAMEVFSEALHQVAREG